MASICLIYRKKNIFYFFVEILQGPQGHFYLHIWRFLSKLYSSKNVPLSVLKSNQKQHAPQFLGACSTVPALSEVVNRVQSLFN
ncbi:hypothetical protein GDO86_013038 [Hymenochirus boettgeri]|uniref:Uncharacterized protein n=1 Tax=Hymenochirus boettgeri TaxID=247094 RepID=A0A8T2ITM9_9PIPI|nr:hypothetical protein GDO86_013038 [Hymenochirus boettgeri]